MSIINWKLWHKLKGQSNATLKAARDYYYHASQVEPRYDITHFSWDGVTLTGYADDLWSGNANYSFPNGKRLFYIHNLRTGGFRRFRLETADALEYNFVSEDGIKCKIYHEVDFREEDFIILAEANTGIDILITRYEQSVVKSGKAFLKDVYRLRWRGHGCHSWNILEYKTQLLAMAQMRKLIKASVSVKITEATPKSGKIEQLTIENYEHA